MRSIMGTEFLMDNGFLDSAPNGCSPSFGGASGAA
jgi:hypothetical protein